MRKIEILSVFSLFFDRGGSVCGCIVYIYAHTHTSRGVLRCESRGLDETPGGPEESRWTKSRHTYVRVCFQVHMCMCMLGGAGDEILD